MLAALDRARTARLRLRPIGSGHSWSRVACPEEVALTLENLSGVVAIDAVGHRVTVRGGTTLRALSDALDDVGLAMPILGSISAQTIAGAVSTGTHGSSLAQGNLASLVTEMRLAVPGERARVEVLREGTPELEAARVSMGALGVITEVTLKVAPAFRLMESVEQVSTIRAVDRLDEIAASAPFVKVWWLPGSGPMHVFRYHPTQLSTRESSAMRWLDEHVVNPVLFEGIIRLSRLHPGIIPPLNVAVARGYLDRPRATVARSDRALNVAMPPRHHETEYALPFPAAAAVLQQLVRTVEDGRMRVAFPLEIRFVAADDGWMSPAYGEPMVHVGVYSGIGADRDRYFAAFEALAQAHGGRPHWGKECSVDAAYVARVFPRAADFASMRDRFDPRRVLGSEAIDRLLGR